VASLVRGGDSPEAGIGRGRTGRTAAAAEQRSGGRGGMEFPAATLKREEIEIQIKKNNYEVDGKSWYD
jgi:hypothetical protein